MRRGGNLPALQINSNKFGNMGLSDYSATNRGPESSFRLGALNTEIDESEDDFNEFTTSRNGRSPDIQAPLHFVPEGENEDMPDEDLRPEDYIDYYQHLENDDEDEYQAEINEINKGENFI